MARRAQSSGECPGSRVTLREGLVGLLECVGGGARVEVPGWRSYWACWARRFGRGGGRVDGAERREEEVEEVLGLRLLSFGGRGGGAMRGDGAEREGGSGGGIVELAEARAIAAAEAGGSAVEGEREKDGTGPFALGPFAALAFGVVCGDSGGDDAIAITGVSASAGVFVVVTSILGEEAFAPGLGFTPVLLAVTS